MSARHELLEAAGYLEAHGCLPEALATTAVREVVEPLMPGDKAEIVVALQMAAQAAARPPAPAESADTETLRDVLLKHHPIAHTMTGPLKGCRCGQVKLGQDVIAHVAAQVIAALPASPAEEAVKRVEALAEEIDAEAAEMPEMPFPTTWAAKRIRAALASPAPAPQGGGTEEAVRRELAIRRALSEQTTFSTLDGEDR